MPFSKPQNIPDKVLEAYRELGLPIAIDIIEMGLINKTYKVTTNNNIKYILQEMSPIFNPDTIKDCDVVSKHLSYCGVLAPTLYRTDQDELFVITNDRLFRALKYIEGKTTHTISSLIMAESAGRIVGKFHLALLELEYNYRSTRRHGGDYLSHRENLIKALKEHAGHDYFSLVSPLAEKMLFNMNKITEGFITTKRNAHGDPKISNIIFNEKDEALCLVDFDTLGNTGWSLEIGDALRSWCNPNKEDILDSYVDLNIAKYALKGYGSIMRGHFSKKEAEEVIIHSQAITLCLAMRYLTDVLNESYFSFDKDRFSRAAEHNWLRTRAMHGLFIDFVAKKNSISEMVRDCLLV